MSAALTAALPSLLGNLPTMIASLFGAKSSGQREVNQLTAELLRRQLQELQRTQPMRQGLEASLLGRLPTYMKANFPSMLSRTGQTGVPFYNAAGGRVAPYGSLPTGSAVPRFQ